MVKDNFEGGFLQHKAKAWEDINGNEVFFVQNACKEKMELLWNVDTSEFFCWLPSKKQKHFAGILSQANS